MRRKKAMLLCTIVTAVILSILMTWAWIEGTDKPAVQGSNLQVTTASGLVLKIGGQYTKVIDLNQFCKDAGSDSIVLYEASSADGKTIYIRNLSSMDKLSEDNVDKVYLREPQEKDQNAYYLYLQFTINADSDESVPIYFKDTKIQYTDHDSAVRNLNAIRVSMDVVKLDESGNEDSESDCKIFSVREATTSDGYALLSGVKSIPGSGELPEETDNSYGTYVASNVAVYSFDSFSDEEHPWITLGAHETVQVTMRIWLEGTDAECEDAIAGEDFEFQLYFETPLTEGDTENGTTQEE